MKDVRITKEKNLEGYDVIQKLDRVKIRITAYNAGKKYWVEDIPGNSGMDGLHNFGNSHIEMYCKSNPFSSLQFCHPLSQPYLRYAARELAEDLMINHAQKVGANSIINFQCSCDMGALELYMIKDMSRKGKLVFDYEGELVLSKPTLSHTIRKRIRKILHKDRIWPSSYPIYPKCPIQF